MDFAISSRVWADSNLSTSEKVVLLALDHLGDRDGFSWNGYERLSEVTGINLKSKYLTKIINKLEKDGYILIWRQHGHKGGRGYTHIYWPIIGRTDDQILEIVMRRFVATEDEATAIIGQSGPIYDEIIKRNRVSGKTLEASRDIKKGVAKTPINKEGYPDYTQNSDIGVPETPKNEAEDKKGVPGYPRSIDSSLIVSSPNKVSKGDPPPFGPLTQALADICKLNRETIQRPTRKELFATQEAFYGVGITPAQVLEFDDWRKAHHWSGKKGNDPPSLRQVGEFWGQYEDWVKRGRPGPPAQVENGVKQNGTNRRSNQQTQLTGESLINERTHDPNTDEYVYPDGHREPAG